MSEATALAVPAVADLRKTVLAIVAGWLLPGLGHVLLGRTRRGMLFGALVLGSFGLGLAHDGRLALRDARTPILTGLQVIANLGLGPLDVLARLGVYKEAAYMMPTSKTRDPKAVRRVQIFRKRTSSAKAIYGTAYIWTAGLMNWLLLFDVWDLGRGRKP